MKSIGSSTKYGSMMSVPRCPNRSGSRVCSMFASEPVSRVSTQITRFPRRSSSSQRCEPRNPAPPVTKQVDIVSSLLLLATILSHVAATEEHLTVAPIVGAEDPRRFTDSGIEVSELYTEADLPTQLELGQPGDFPYTRGVHR